MSVHGELSAPQHATHRGNSDHVYLQLRSLHCFLKDKLQGPLIMMSAAVELFGVLHPERLAQMEQELGAGAGGSETEEQREEASGGASILLPPPTAVAADEAALGKFGRPIGFSAVRQQRGEKKRMGRHKAAAAEASEAGTLSPVAPVMSLAGLVRLNSVPQPPIRQAARAHIMPGSMAELSEEEDDDDFLDEDFALRPSSRRAYKKRRKATGYASPPGRGQGKARDGKGGDEVRGGTARDRQKSPKRTGREGRGVKSYLATSLPKPRADLPGRMATAATAQRNVKDNMATTATAHGNDLPSPMKPKRGRPTKAMLQERLLLQEQQSRQAMPRASVQDGTAPKAPADEKSQIRQPTGKKIKQTPPAKKRNKRDNDSSSSSGERSLQPLIHDGQPAKESDKVRGSILSSRSGPDGCGGQVEADLGEPGSEPGSEPGRAASGRHAATAAAAVAAAAAAAAAAVSDSVIADEASAVVGVHVGNPSRKLRWMAPVVMAVGEDDSSSDEDGGS